MPRRAEVNELDSVDTPVTSCYVQSKVAGYKAPTSVEFPEALARTATGKLQKFKLRAPFWQGRERHVN